MKQTLSGIAMMVFFGITSFVLAQTKPITIGNSTINTVSQRNAVSTSTHMFNLQLMDTLNAINKDVKSKKITQPQAQTLRAAVKTIRIQEFQFMKENGNKLLTADQITQLNQQLNSLSSSL